MNFGGLERMGRGLLDIRSILMGLPIVLIALTVHEVAHGFVAYKMGDETAKQAGRLSLNPLRHLDVLGTICMVLFGFGWAKPVPVNPMNFKKGSKSISLVGLAGPLSNFILAFLIYLVYEILIVSGVSMSLFVQSYFGLAIGMNIGLGVFNLLPIPPLDGSKIISPFLPYNAYVWYVRYERYITIILFVALYLGVLSRPLNWLSNGVLRGIGWLVQTILTPFGA